MFSIITPVFKKLWWRKKMFYNVLLLYIIFFSLFLQTFWCSVLLGELFGVPYCWENFLVFRIVGRTFWCSVLLGELSGVRIVGRTFWCSYCWENFLVFVLLGELSFLTISIWSANTLAVYNLVWKLLQKGKDWWTVICFYLDQPRQLLYFNFSGQISIFPNKLSQMVEISKAFLKIYFEYNVPTKICVL